MSSIELQLSEGETKLIRLRLFNKSDNSPVISTGNDYVMIADNGTTTENITGVLQLGDFGIYFDPTVLTGAVGNWTMKITRTVNGETDTPISGTVSVT